MILVFSFVDFSPRGLLVSIWIKCTWRCTYALLCWVSCSQIGESHGRKNCWNLTWYNQEIPGMNIWFFNWSKKRQWTFKNTNSEGSIRPEPVYQSLCKRHQFILSQGLVDWARFFVPFSSHVMDMESSAQESPFDPKTLWNSQQPTRRLVDSSTEGTNTLYYLALHCQRPFFGVWGSDL